MSDWLAAPIEVIPAVDVLGEGAVRLHRGDYEQVVDEAGDPVALATRFAEAGASRIHLVDLDGARSGHARPELVRTVAAAVAPTPLQASGGIRSLEDARALIAAGADRIVLGTAAFPDPAPWAAALGNRLVVALDVRDGVVRSAGWTAESGLTTERAIELCLAAGVEGASSAPRSTGTGRLPARTSSSCGRSPPPGSTFSRPVGCGRRTTCARSPPPGRAQPSSGAPSSARNRVLKRL